MRAQLMAGWCNTCRHMHSHRHKHCAVQFLSLLEPGKKTFALTTFANWTLLFWNTQSSVQPPIMGWAEPHSLHQHIRLQNTIKGTWEKIFGCNTTTTLIIYIQLLLGVWGRLFNCMYELSNCFLMWKSHWETKMWLNLNIGKTFFFLSPKLNYSVHGKNKMSYIFYWRIDSSQVLTASTFVR